MLLSQSHIFALDDLFLKSLEPPTPGFTDETYYKKELVNGKIGVKKFSRV